jgi:RimJ/RimL family protein N-acetyltransferase/catechol 2,3-dioxygenase-like lactoylglutathione lyase family enzyme
LPDLGLTHVALPVTNLARSIAFYARYAKMNVVHRRPRPSDPGLEIAWLSDRTRPFVVVLVEAASVDRPLGPFAHLGVACADRGEVDRLCDLARLEGCLREEPSEMGGAAGYLAMLSDPDGHTLELSFGQEVGYAVEAAVARVGESTGPELRAFVPIRTERLLLRWFEPGDAMDVRRLAGDRAIAANTLQIPHPYEAGVAEEWIGSHPARRMRGEALVFAIELAEGGELIGAIGLELALAHRRAEIGYWIGRPFWGRGYATEAASAVVRYAFDELDLNRIHAGHFPRNPASGRVLEKIGLRPEGRRRQHVLKGDRFEDLIEYGVLREEFESRKDFERREHRRGSSVDGPSGDGG